MRLVSSCVFGLLALTLLPAAAPAAAQDTVYGCVLNGQGQLRLVNAPGECRPKERPVQWQSGADLSEITAAIDAVRSRVGAVEQAVEGLPALTSRVTALEVLPAVVPLSVHDATGRGNTSGCDLVRERHNEPMFRVRCNENADVTTPKTGTSVFIASPPDMAYTYDGLYLCGISSQGLRDRGASLRLHVYFHETEVAGGEVSLQRRDTSLNANRRALQFDFPATAFTPLEVDAPSNGKRPCVTLRFAQGVQDGEHPRLPNDIWIPSSEVDIYMPLPAMLPTAPGQFGDFLTISQVGLMVAGRRPAAP